MIVKVEKGLDYIKQYLQSVGKYEVYLETEYSGPTDAIIYMNENSNEYFETFQEQLRVQNLVEHEHVDHGIIIINAKNKSPKEIEQILDARLYNNIF